MNDLEFNKRMDELVELLVGKKVINNGLGEGTVIEVGDRVTVEFSGTKKTLTRENFFNYNKPVDESLLSEVEQATKAHDVYVEALRIEAEKRAKELAEQRRKNAASATKDKKKIKIDDLFDENYHIEHLNRTPILTYSEIENEFGVNIHGFSRGINATNNSIILISSMSKKGGRFVYHDHWTKDGDYIYSGEGKTGDQKLTRGNKAIVDAKNDDKTIYLFVKLSSEEYYFQGPVELVDYTYEDAKDENGNVRKEYKFRLSRLKKEDDFEYDSNILNRHIYLEWHEGFQSFAILNKHESNFVIDDRKCIISYTANRSNCNSVSKIISKINYTRLIRLFDKYYSILSDETRTSYEIAPFGGLCSFKYEFNGKSNLNLNGVPSLFKGNDDKLVKQAYKEYKKVIDDILNQ